MREALLSQTRPAPAARGQDQGTHDVPAYRLRHPNRVPWAICGLAESPIGDLASIGIRCGKNRGGRP